MSYDLIYTSCSINQTSAAAHWGRNNLICFASSHLVNIYDPTYGSGGKITFSLLAHSKHVNSTRWLTGKHYETELVSGSVDGKVIVWSSIEADYVPSVIAECNANVIVADGCYKDPHTEHCVFVISTSNNYIHIYERYFIEDKITIIQTINLGKHVAMTMKFSRLPVTHTMLFGLGTDTGSFILYAEDETGTFHKHTEINAHSEWIRGLDFMPTGSDVLFATASQDAKVKVWRIKAYENLVLDANHVRNDLIRKNVRFRTNDVEFVITLDTILYGHDSWIYSVNFNSPHLEMISTSVDKTMIIWHKPEGSDIWVEKDRFGEIGTSNLGYLGGMFGPKGDIFAHGFFGSFHLWEYSNKNKKWKPAVTLGGHAKEVVDLSWEPHGQFIYSMSRDQTTRIHAPWTLKNQQTTWHEIARPQIHGYEMTCLAVLSRYEYAAGSEEKVIRTLKAPRNFIDNLKRICKISCYEEDNDLGKCDQDIPQGAALPSLGLSNKAVYGDHDTNQRLFSGNSDRNLEPETNFVSLVLNEPPSEEDLLQNTLWPETHKLYGHGNELFTMAATCDGAILASACKATSRELACILLWDTASWVQLDKLESHNLTVCQLSFSPDSKHLLSVSRDRRWTLFSIDSSGKYKISATTDSRSGIHSRIIWCCAWLPNSNYFATGSRDGKVVIWKENPNTTEFVGRYCSAGSFLDLKGESVTALAAASIYIHNLVLLAIGLDSGIIHLYLWNDKAENDQWKVFFTINQRDAHHKTVKRLTFRSKMGRAGSDDGNNILQLASCGSDGIVRVFDIKL